MINAWWLLLLGPFALVGVAVVLLLGFWVWAFMTENMRDGR